MLTNDNSRVTDDAPCSGGAGRERAFLNLHWLTRGKVILPSGFLTLLFVCGHTTLNIGRQPYLMLPLLSTIMRIISSEVIFSKSSIGLNSYSANILKLSSNGFYLSPKHLDIIWSWLSYLNATVPGSAPPQCEAALTGRADLPLRQCGDEVSSWKYKQILWYLCLTCAS